MAILVDASTRVMTQGFTGAQGTFHAEQGIAYGSTYVGGVGQVVGGDDGEPALGQDLLAQLDVRALQPHHQRHLEGQVLARRDDAGGDHVALGDAAEDVHQDRLDVGVRGDDPERLRHLIGPHRVVRGEC